MESLIHCLILHLELIFFYKTGYHNPATGDTRKIYPYLKSFKRKPEGVVIGYQSESKYQSDYPRYDFRL